jgi:flavorubredoxin
MNIFIEKLLMPFSNYCDWCAKRIPILRGTYIKTAHGMLMPEKVYCSISCFNKSVIKTFGVER